MEPNKLMNNLDEAYNALQRLGVQPTKTNMEIMLTVLNALQEAFRFIRTVIKEEGEEDGADKE